MPDFMILWFLTILIVPSANRFDLPFGKFTEVNNYRQCVCFAEALMKSETADSFVQLFRKFLELVNYKVPNVDNDAAIGSWNCI